MRRVGSVLAVLVLALAGASTASAFHRLKGPRVVARVTVGD